MYQTVAEAARAAAVRDPRFSPVTRDELVNLDIEISLLSPFEEIEPDEIIVGKHGLMLTSCDCRGLLLPQVATERGWDRNNFLDHLCLKAGLARGAWRADDVKLRAFTATIISQKEFLQN